MKKVLPILLLLMICFAGTAFASEQVFFYHTDPAGTPLAMTNANGTVVWQADYKPFGEEYSTAGTATNDRRFVGKEKDEETGLSYFGARYEDAKIGRFIAPDPVRAVDPHSSKTYEKLLMEPQRLNTYAYALNNPNRWCDPQGLEVPPPGLSYPDYNKEPAVDNKKWQNGVFEGSQMASGMALIGAKGNALGIIKIEASVEDLSGIRMTGSGPEHFTSEQKAKLSVELLFGLLKVENDSPFVSTKGFALTKIGKFQIGATTPSINGAPAMNAELHINFKKFFSDPK